MCCHWQQSEVVRPAPLADLITEYDAAGIMVVMGPTSLTGATASIAERCH